MKRSSKVSDGKRRLMKSKGCRVKRGRKKEDGRKKEGRNRGEWE